MTHLIQLYMTVEVSVRPSNVDPPVLVLANPEDPVCDFAATERAVGAMPNGTLEAVTWSQAKHIIAGRHCSPATIDRTVERIVTFLRSV